MLQKNQNEIFGQPKTGLVGEIEKEQEIVKQRESQTVLEVWLIGIKRCSSEIEPLALFV